MPSTSNDTKSVAIYCRISRAEKDDQGTTSTESVESQERRCREFAKQQGWTVTEVYTDNSLSGGNRNRPEFKRLENELDGVDVVLAIDKDRLSRDLLTDLQFRNTCIEADTQIWTISEGYENPDDSLISNIKASVAEDYRKQVSRKQKARIKDRKIQGEITPGRYRLFGYADKKKTALDPAEAKLVKQVFEMVAAGSSNFTICDMLNDSGLKTSSGERWRARNISLMVKNPAYKGWIYDTDGELLSKNAKWEPIVSEQLFERAQKKLSKKKKFEGRGSPKRMLSGVLYCGGVHADGELCLYKMPVQKTANGPRYRCPPGNGCGKCSIKAEWADWFISEHAVKPLLDILPEDDADLPDYSDEIAEIDAHLERIRYTFEMGDKPLDEYKRDRASLNAKKDALLEKSTNSTSDLGSYERFVNNTVDQQRETIKQLFPNGITILPGNRSRHFDLELFKKRFKF